MSSLTDLMGQEMCPEHQNHLCILDASFLALGEALKVCSGLMGEGFGVDSEVLTPEEKKNGPFFSIL